MIRSRRLVPALAGAALVGGVALAAPAGAGILEGPEPTIVSIGVELDLPYLGEGPAVFEVLDAPVGLGPELTGDDLVENPSDWCGSLNVDIDNVVQTITITPDEVCDFATAVVVVEGSGIDSLTTEVDELWAVDEETGCEMGPAIASAADGVAVISWSTPNPDSEDEGCSTDMLEDGVAVFSYGSGMPTTTTTSTSTTSTTVAPTTSTTAAAQPAVVTPRFTG